jgi:hypothetical protein
MPVSSGPGGPSRYSVPYTGAVGYHAPLPYAGGYPMQHPYAGFAPMQAAYAARMPVPLANWLPDMVPSLPLPDYALPELDYPVLAHMMSTVEPPTVDPVSKQVTKLTDDLTAACAAGKITIEQAIKVSLGTANVLEAGTNREPALKDLRAELRLLRRMSSLSASEFRKLSDEVDALIGKDK